MLYERERDKEREIEGWTEGEREREKNGIVRKRERVRKEGENHSCCLSF
jgi:hypothetical protein